MKQTLSIAASLALGLLACSDPGTSGGSSDLGVAGASCLRTPDCRAPLQCIANVCTDLSPDGMGGVGDALSDTTDTSSEPPDTANPFYDGPQPDVVTDYDASAGSSSTPHLRPTPTTCPTGLLAAAPISASPTPGAGPSWARSTSR